MLAEISFEARALAAFFDEVKVTSSSLMILDKGESSLRTLLVILSLSAVVDRSSTLTVLVSTPAMISTPFATRLLDIITASAPSSSLIFARAERISAATKRFNFI